MYQIQKIRTHIDYVEEDPAMYYLLVNDSARVFVGNSGKNCIMRERC